MLFGKPYKGACIATLPEMMHGDNTMKLDRMKKFILIPIATLSAIAVGITICSNKLIESRSAPNIYSSSSTIPNNRVGLVLGTSKLTVDNRLNLYFKYRVDAAVELYKSGKIQKILVSGDNSYVGYDEPTDFKNALIEAGIPPEDIHLDYAGFRTLDSVVRAKEIFGLGQVTIISQEFHNQRAIFIADYYSVNAIGFNARDVAGTGGLKTNMREKLARVKAVLDLYLFRTKPKFLGERIEIT